MKNLIGIDIGGTKISYHLLNERLKIIDSKIYKTDDIGGGSLKLLDYLITTIKKEDKKNIKKIGISINAAVQDNTILKSSVLGVENFPIGNYVKTKTKINARIENDVIAQCIAEYKFGYGKRYKNFAMLNIGTGTRVCYCQNGTIVNGYRNMAGEVSQTKIYSPELKKYFILDEFISGRGIRNIYRELSAKDKTAEDIFKSKDAYSQKTIDIFKNYLNLLFEHIAYFYNPHALILTGSIFNSSGVFLPEAINKFYKSNFDFFRFKVLKSKLKYGNILGVLA